MSYAILRRYKSVDNFIPFIGRARYSSLEKAKEMLHFLDAEDSIYTYEIIED